ncbi:MAG TPA: carboxypeptidase-like regulatory domain-containing protein [Thermoanaerobaculia bacterium]|nr:carboxypeptidase-like regulatory domain-containing protein [Thermoanaerobaculia bacterium]
MRSFASSLLVAALVAGAIPVAGAEPEATVGLGGLVRSNDGPIESARVYAYQVTELTITRAVTDQQGHFLFNPLPVGVYKIIAHKVGFVPAVVLFTRATQSAADFLEFELSPEQSSSFQDTEDFWSIRRRIPGDVLREIEIASALGDPQEVADANPGGLAFETEMMAGLDDNPAGLSQLTSGRIGMQGRVGRLMLELDGRFDELRPESTSGSSDLLAEGRTNSLDVSLASGGSSAVQFHTVRHTLDHHPMMAKPVDFERYQVAWQKGLRSGAESNVSAQYFEESGFHSQGLVKPAGLPDGSRTLHVNGTYQQDLGDRMALRTGVSYQEMLLDTQLGNTLPALVRQRVNAFGIGSTELGSGLVVEYGLYSMLLDGTFAVAPHGGVVVELGDDWKLDAVARKRFRSEEESGLGTFGVAYFRDIESEPAADDHYYQVGFVHGREGGESLRLAAVHRRIGDTLRVFFTDDFFDQIESVYLVRGDELPELQFALSLQVAPQILTTLESTVGSGGGGVLLTADDTPFENQVSYVVTSLDTRFQQTSTGVFLAVHRVEQRLEPLRSLGSATDVNLEKLQLKLTQELDYFLDFGTDLAVLLNVELSRGDLVYGRALADDLHRRVAGGIAVKF